MNETAERLKGKLDDSRAFLNAVLDAVGERWDAPIYSDRAGWTAGQLLIHLMVADRGQSKTVQLIAQGGDPIPADFDLERYNRGSVEKNAGMTPEQARAIMHESRAGLLAWLETVTDSDLEKSGRHASGNIFTVAQYLKIMALHERDHANDMVKALNITIP